MNSLEDLEAADMTEDNPPSAVPFKSSVYLPLKMPLRFFLEMKILFQWKFFSKIFQFFFSFFSKSIILEASYCLIDICSVNENSNVVRRNLSVYIKAFLCPDNGRQQKLFYVRSILGCLLQRILWVGWHSDVSGKMCYFTKLGIGWESKKGEMCVCFFILSIIQQQLFCFYPQFSCVLLNQIGQR